MSCNLTLMPLYLAHSSFGLGAAISLAPAAATWAASHLCFEISASLTSMLQLSARDSIHFSFHRQAVASLCTTCLPITTNPFITCPVPIKYHFTHDFGSCDDPNHPIMFSHHADVQGPICAHIWINPSWVCNEMHLSAEGHFSMLIHQIDFQSHNHDLCCAGQYWAFSLDSGNQTPVAQLHYQEMEQDQLGGVIFVWAPSLFSTHCIRVVLCLYCSPSPLLAWLGSHQSSCTIILLWECIQALQSSHLQFAMSGLFHQPRTTVHVSGLV